MPREKENYKIRIYTLPGQRYSTTQHFPIENSTIVGLIILFTVLKLYDMK